MTESNAYLGQKGRKLHSQKGLLHLLVFNKKTDNTKITPNTISNNPLHSNQKDITQFQNDVEETP
jgi:hypothetical protein